jgi:hypothetical protein
MEKQNPKIITLEFNGVTIGMQRSDWIEKLAGFLVDALRQSGVYRELVKQIVVLAEGIEAAALPSAGTMDVRPIIDLLAGWINQEFQTHGGPRKLPDEICSGVAKRIAAAIAEEFDKATGPWKTGSSAAPAACARAALLLRSAAELPAPSGVN